MKKFYLMLLIMSGISLLFYFGGLVESNPLIDYLFNIQNLTSSEIWTLIVAGVVSTGLGITVGVITKNIELAVMTSVVPIVLTLLWNIVAVFNRLFAFNPVIAILIFAPVLYMFMFVMLDWWRGIE